MDNTGIVVFEWHCTLCSEKYPETLRYKIAKSTTESNENGTEQILPVVNLWKFSWENTEHLHKVSTVEISVTEYRYFYRREVNILIRCLSRSDSRWMDANCYTAAAGPEAISSWSG